MGLIVDTNVFIQFEKRRLAIDLSSWEPTERVYISVVTAAELLMGVHRADTDERKKRRGEFVEALLAGVGVLDFTLGAARIHAELYATLAKQGRMVGAHDLIIAATARFHGLTILTENVAEFSRVPDLRVVPFIM
jgi:predicted nucleic acid-binding protein